MGDRILAGKPSWYAASHPGQLSLAGHLAVVFRSRLKSHIFSLMPISDSFFLLFSVRGPRNDFGDSNRFFTFTCFKHFLVCDVHVCRYRIFTIDLEDRQPQYAKKILLLITKRL